ncbi:glycosyltransferase, partial [bacterium]|nr:glycosyltransferase [bacterium]
MKIDKPRFSIVIPTYNTSVVLRQCIKALCNQPVDKRCFEVIVVNDGGKKDILKDIEGLNGEF